MADGENTKKPELVIRPFAFYLKAFWQFPFLMSFMILAEIGQAGFMVTMPLAVKQIVHAAEIHDPAAGTLWSGLSQPFWGLVLVIAAMTLCSRASGVALIFFARKMRRMPRIWLFRHLLGHSVEYFLNRHGGALGAKIHDVTSSVAMATWTLLFEFLYLVIMFSVSVFTVGTEYWPIGAIIGVWGILYGTLISSLTIPRARWIQKVSRARAKLTGLIIDSVSNILSVKAYARAQHEEDIIGEATNEVEY